MKKLLIFVLIALLLSTNAYAYNKDLSLEYASFHFDDGKGLCAEFVSDCLRAGGINVSANECNALYDELTKKLGYQCSPLEVEIDGRISLKKNAFCLNVGDIIIQECHECQTFFHVVLCGGEYNGYVTFYAHNAAHGNTKNDVFYNIANNLHKGHRAIAYVIRLGSEKETDKKFPSEFKLYTVDAPSGLNLRKSASTEADIVNTLEDKTIVTVFPSLSQEEWSYCKADAFDGYLKNEYLTETVIHKNSSVPISVDGKTLASTPIIIEQRSLLPGRDIFEALGGEVSWNDELKTAKISIDGHTVTLKHLDTFMYVNGEKKDVLEPSVIIDGKLYVGARGVSEGLNRTVLWENNSIKIN